MENHVCPLCEMSAPPACPAAGRAFHHCDRCDLIWVPRAWHLSPEAEAERYRRHENSAADAGYDAFLRRAIEPLKADAAIRRVLDYGSGPEPVLLSLLHDAGFDAVGYDPYFAPDADLSRPFDAVVSVETFEHFAQPHAETEKIIGLIHPGGLLVVVTRFHPGTAAMRDWWYARDPTHVAFYSMQTMRWIGKRFGFTLEDSNDTDMVVLRRDAAAGESP